VVWLYSLYFAATASTVAAAVWGIREASAAAALVLCSFNLLRLSIRDGHRGWGPIFRRSRVWFLGTAGIVLFCQTKWFLSGARLGVVIEDIPPTPIYGHPGVYLYLGYFGVGLLLLTLGCLRDCRQTRAST